MNDFEEFKEMWLDILKELFSKDTAFALMTVGSLTLIFAFVAGYMP